MKTMIRLSRPDVGLGIPVRPILVGALLLAANAAALLPGAALQAQGAPEGSPAERWREETPRLYVGRVPGHKDLNREKIGRVRDAGFTGYIDRWIAVRHKNIDRQSIEARAELAAEAGLEYAPWYRGTVPEKGKNPDLRMVWENGVVQPLHAPLSPALWEHLRASLTYFAKLSSRGQATAAFLDFENYAPNKQANAYAVSYDRHALRLFAEARGGEAPPKDLAPGEGPEWIEAQGRKRAFEQWQESEFRRRLRELRADLDAIDAGFVVGFYAASGMLDGNLDAFATEAAPVVLTSAYGYGRASQLLDQRLNLLADANAGRERMAALRQRDMPFFLLSGILPGYRGADPEFNGKNLSYLAEVTDGVWVWDEGKGPTDEHMEWMRIANEEIDRGESRLHHEPRLEREIASVAAPEFKKPGLRIALYGERGDNLRQPLEEAGFAAVRKLTSLDPAYLEHFDAVMLQNFLVSLPYGSEVHEVLRDYVRGGGALLLTHRTGRLLESPFPRIAVRGRPEHKVLAGLQVADTAMRLRQGAGEWLGEGGKLASDGESAFQAGFSDHVIFKPGPAGRVLVENRFGEAVYVAGRHGDGRVAYIGNFMGYARPPQGLERDVLTAVLRWLAADKAPEGGER